MRAICVEHSVLVKLGEKCEHCVLENNCEHCVLVKLGENTHSVCWSDWVKSVNTVCWLVKLGENTHC